MDEMLEDLYGKDPQDLSKLHPDLKPWLQEISSLGMTMLNHPLVQQILPLWKPANAMYEAKKKQLAKAEAEGDYGHALALYERPWRLPRLWAYFRDGQINAVQLYDLLSRFWNDSEHPSQFGKRFLNTMFRTAFAAGGVVTDVQGTPEEIKRMALPLTTVTLFRGVSKRTDGRGMSWTKDASRAAWFATRLSKNGLGYVFGCEVEPDGIWGIFEDRGESEVVINPRKIKSFRLLEVIRPDAPSRVPLAERWASDEEGEKS